MEDGRQHSLLPAKLEQEKQTGTTVCPQLAWFLTKLEPNTSSEMGQLNAFVLKMMSHPNMYCIFTCLWDLYSVFNTDSLNSLSNCKRLYDDNKLTPSPLFST